MDFLNSRRYCCEFLGTLFLSLAVLGSGIMAKNLSADEGLALFANAVVTGLTLYTLISLLAPISGAHLNPIVSICFWLKGDSSKKIASFYIFFQTAGAFFGCVIANFIFDLSVISISTTERTGAQIVFSEFFASFGLILVVMLGSLHSPQKIPSLVGCYITAAILFSSSNSFANPALTIARQFSDTFCGISPNSISPYIIVQLIAVFLAYRLYCWLLSERS